MNIPTTQELKPRLVRNRIKCLQCETILESVHSHDYNVCGCPNRTMIDGGLSYQRFGGVLLNLIEDMSEWDDDVSSR